MGLKFCEECGRLLHVIIENDKIIGKCDCGKITELGEDFVFKEKIKKKDEIGEGVVFEIESAGYPHKCEKCGHGECCIYDIKAGYSDESDIILYYMPAKNANM